jgi:hypothetical protein
MEKNTATWVLVISLCLYIGFIPSKADVYSLFPLSKALSLYLTDFFLLFVCQYGCGLWPVGEKKTPIAATK